MVLLFSVIIFVCQSNTVSAKNKHNNHHRKMVLLPSLHIGGLDSAYLQLLVERGYYRPAQNCPDSIAILPPAPISTYNEDFAVLKTPPNRIARLWQLCYYRSTTLPIFYVDTFNNYYFDYNIRPENIGQKLLEAKEARFATLCRSHVAFAKVPRQM